MPDVKTRPQVIEDVSAAYSDRGKGVILLTGNTHDLFPSPKTERYVDLGYTLYHHLSGLFTVLRLDISTGLEVYQADDLKELQASVNKADSATMVDEEKVGDLKRKMATTSHSPLPALVLVHEILKAVKKARVDLKMSKSVKPVCVIVRFAGSLFPAGDFNNLSDIDRQRLVTFLNLVESQWFKDSGHLLLLLADTRSEVNSRIQAQPNVHGVEVELPGEAARRVFVEHFLARMAQPQAAAEAPPSESNAQSASGQPAATAGAAATQATAVPQAAATVATSAVIAFEPSQEAFIADTAGLTLSSLADMLEKARRTADGKPSIISRKDVLEAINIVMKAELGDIISIKMPEHRPSDVVGYEETGKILRRVLARCEKVDTAIPAFLLSGANGVGKTYQLEAYAAESGRVVIELTGLRGMYYGQTDGFFEKLRLRLKTYGKILILVDEAHTQFGSVHKEGVHETEKRLAGNIIKMMSDPTLLSKVVWALGTSRPDELDPDVKSRAPIQIPIFDLEGDARRIFVLALFKRSGINLGAEGEIDEVLKLTAAYSSRDLSFLIKEVKGGGGDANGSQSVRETLEYWQASSSIQQQRRMQTLIAAQHCSYPKLMPPALAALIKEGMLEGELNSLRARLLH